MEVPSFLEAVEQSGISVWIRETPTFFGFYFLLTVHTIGLSLVVGPNAVIDLRLLGVAPEIPLAPLKGWFRLMWIGLTAAVGSGIALACAYPVMALTNPIFYLKLILLGFAVWTLVRIRTRVFGDATLGDAAMSAKGKGLAVLSIALWLSVVASGRLLAYTCNYLLFGVPCF